MAWQEVAQAVAPTIATGLFGPLGGVVANIAAGFLFGPDAGKGKVTPQAVAERIGSLTNPADIAKLRDAEAAVQRFEADNKFRFAELEAQGQQQARTMRMGALASGNKTADQLSWLVMGSFLIVAGGVLAGCALLASGRVSLDNANPQTWVAISGLVGAILGYFSANAQQVVGFYFGSSAGSAAKSDQLAQATTSALAAVNRPAPAAQQPSVVRMDTPAGPITAASGEPAADLVAAGADPLAAGAAGQRFSVAPEARWDTCIAFILEREGGYVNDPADAGRATNMGITRATLSSWRGEPVSDDDVRNLTTTEAKTIYRALYWNVARCDGMPPGVDLVLMDSAVMSGPSRGVRFLQEACGMRGQDVDGIVGPQTLDAVKRARVPTLIDAITSARRAFYEGVIERNPERGKFRDGWMNRVALAQERADSMLHAWT